MRRFHGPILRCQPAAPEVFRDDGFSGELQAAEKLSAVIPGRRVSAEPGIQFRRDFLLNWIPGSPLRGVPE
jgi:hypothetical protein